MKKKELNDIKMKSEKLKMIYVHFLISFQQQHKKITFLYILQFYMMKKYFILSSSNFYPTPFY